MKVTAKAKAAKYGGKGFQIAYKTSGTKWKYVKSTTTAKAVKVANNKKYTVKIRAYKKVKGKMYYGAWSKTKASIKKVKITFNANKGNVKPKSKLVWSNGKYGKLPKPTRSRYKFRGWYTKKKGGVKITAKTPMKKYNNHTIYAHWFGPKGKGGKISMAEYNRLDYGMSYSDVCYLIGGEGNRISSYTDTEYVEDGHWETVEDGYYDEDWVDTDYGDGYSTSTWVDTSYEEYVDDSYEISHYHETYSFDGQRKGMVDLEFVDDKLDEIYTYGFK